MVTSHDCYFAHLLVAVALVTDTVSNCMSVISDEQEDMCNLICKTFISSIIVLFRNLKVQFHLKHLFYVFVRVKLFLYFAKFDDSCIGNSNRKNNSLKLTFPITNNCPPHSSYPYRWLNKREDSRVFFFYPSFRQSKNHTSCHFCHCYH